jgi:GT2 family glycosyltransferase
MFFMHLSIIIVNWNSKIFLDKCISSIIKNTKQVDFEIIVIDSGSFDGSSEMIRQRYPRVKFLQGQQNLGFAKANNEAFITSCGSNILFLNPDTEVESRSVHALLKNLESITRVGAVGARLLNSDGSVQSTCIRAFPTILNQILDAEVLKKESPFSRLWGMAPLYDQPAKTSKVDAVSGACLMVKRAAFAEVGMFSTDYFMYSEDIDLCYKLNAAGLDNYYIPDATVVHHGGASTAQNSVTIFSDVMMLESRFRYFRKTRSAFYCRLYQLSMLFVSAIRISLLLIFRPFFKDCEKVNLIGKGLIKWMARLRWTLGHEKWVKNL